MNRWVSVALVLAALGCGSSPAPVVPFTDGRHRSCNYDTAASASPHVTCDVDPGTYISCTSPETPAYILTTLGDVMPTWENCVACHTDHLYGITTECGPVECDVAADCPMSHSLCTGGVCHRDF